MKTLIKISTVFLVLGAVSIFTGCAPMPYQGTYYEVVEVIVVHEPPIICPGPPRLPPRSTPLTKLRDSGSPRTKTPRGDRSSEGPVIARGQVEPNDPPPKVTRSPGKRPGPRRR